MHFFSLLSLSSHFFRYCEILQTSLYFSCSLGSYSWFSKCPYFYPNNSLMPQTTTTNATRTAITIKAIIPMSSNISNISKSVSNIQHTKHTRRANAAMLITYDKHPPLIILFRAFFKILYDKLDKLVRQC